MLNGLRHRGSSRAARGFYWNRTRWEVVTMPKAGGVLPGGPEQQYVKVPALVFLVLAPLMGGLYVVFLPLIGFMLVLGFLGRQTSGAVRAAMKALKTRTPDAADDLARREKNAERRTAA